MNNKNIFVSTVFIILTLALYLSSCGQSNLGKFVYPNGRLSDIDKIDSLYNLALNVSKTDNNFDKALLFRNEYGWQLGRINQLELDIPEILNKEEYSHEMAYSKILNIQSNDPNNWEEYLELCSSLLKKFKKGSTEYREVLGIKSEICFLTNKNDMALEVLPEFLNELTKNTDHYFTMLWHYGLAQSNGGDEEKAIITFKKGFKAEIKAPNHLQFAKSLMNLYLLHAEYDSIISEKTTILKDTSGVLLYFLGEAYSKKGNTSQALEYFDTYISHFKETERQPYLIIENGFVMHSIRPQHLLVLAEFYSDIDSEKSCKCYNYIQKILSQPKNDILFQKQLAAIKDKDEKDAFKKKHDEYENSLREILKKANNKLKSCK